MRWFRYYSEALHDPKIQGLSGNDFKSWVNLLCLANESEPRGSLPCESDVGFALRITTVKAHDLMTRFLTVGLLDLNEHVPGVVVHKWNKWQPVSDDAAERMANKRRTSSEHVPTRLDQNRTEQIQNRLEGETPPNKNQTRRYEEMGGH